MVHRLPRKQIRITDLLLRTESEFADGVKHQHPVIAHIVILCPHRVYTTAADDRLVDLIVKFLYFIFHNLPHSIPFGTEWSIRQDFEIVNTADHIALTSKVAEEMGLFPYYLYRQKNMAGNFENVGYAAPGKAGVYNVLIMEEKQSIVACGAGASTKRVWVQPNPDGTHRIERAENVKDVAQYITRIDEMIERKGRLFTKE
mgnify:FL=1